jgi:hypothetical protein
MAACCTPILHGWFVREELHRVGLRHSIDCQVQPGNIEAIGKRAWRTQGRKIRTGEVYQ